MVDNYQQILFAKKGMPSCSAGSTVYYEVDGERAWQDYLERTGYGHESAWDL